jgi:hypothetical protein
MSMGGDQQLQTSMQTQQPLKDTVCISVYIYL